MHLIPPLLFPEKYLPCPFLQNPQKPKEGHLRSSQMPILPCSQTEIALQVKNERNA
jgi:hypothetical protein